jgi:multidrug efflux system membrane fusion protein
VRYHMGLRTIVVAFLLASLCFLWSCAGNRATAKTEQNKDAMPVTVATVVQKDVPVEVRAIGNVEAYSTVSVKSLVNGELVNVYFQEGQEVKKGDLLFKIDPRPFEATLRRAEGNLARDTAQAKQAEANLAKDTAQAKNAETQAHRYEGLLKEGVVAREVFDQFRTSAEAFDATLQADRAAIEYAAAAVRSDRAAIENARLDLENCTISSPMNGRTGNLIVHQGNIIKANENPPLVVINQIQPIYVTFSVPEQHLTEIKRHMSAGKLVVEATVPKVEGHTVQGALTFVDNAVDSSTGTIRLKGAFPNQEKLLWPGQFVNVVLTLRTRPKAVVVPSQAIQTGQGGQYVFVVKPDLTVESRPVLIGASSHGEIVVEKGLEPGETVVTDGQLRLTPGARVEVKKSLGALQEKSS